MHCWVKGLPSAPDAVPLQPPPRPDGKRQFNCVVIANCFKSICRVYLFDRKSFDLPFTFYQQKNKIFKKTKYLKFSDIRHDISINMTLKFMSDIVAETNLISTIT